MTSAPPLYASFDVVPAPKGAAVHIGAFARALGEAFGRIDLVTVAPPDQPPPTDRGKACWKGVHHHPLPARGEHLIARVLAFRAALSRWLGGRRVPLAHVRSIYEGYPLALRKGAGVDRFLFEVNGLPSLELKYHYPGVAEDRELLSKLRAQEDACLAAADLVLTPSAVTASHLASRGVSPERLRVVPNGVDLPLFPHAPPVSRAEGPLRLLYAGTFTAWQGVGLAVEALALLRRELPATLTLVGPARERQSRALRERAQALGVGPHVTLLPPVSQEELARLHHAHDVVLAPLVDNDRNRVQGACPLKLLEAMAAGTPVVASDLPIVREVAEGGVHALLVRPNSPRAIKDALLRLRTEPGLALRLSEAARAHVEARFSWERAQRELVEAYEALGIRRSSTRDSPSAS
ncbi:MAG TPA: glycosyltransferase family 4 protein [Longimicrobium sp.]|nr:glycosyltransferase family 4 protein [Longimicrobium sp.]